VGGGGEPLGGDYFPCFSGEMPGFSGCSTAGIAMLLFIRVVFATFLFGGGCGGAGQWVQDVIASKIVGGTITRLSTAIRRHLFSGGAGVGIFAS